MKEANLLVTYDPAHAGSARSEVQALLEQAGEKAEFLESNVEGLFLLQTGKNPTEVTKELRDAVEEDPEKCKYTFRWIPIEKWCKSSMDDMTRAVKEINSQMNDEDSWKLDLGKRHHEGKTTELIMKLTENINHPKVDLKNPQKIVKIEIIGDRAGVALLDRSELLDIPKMKAK
jgi:tRNA acetyltransferase TAN1